MVGAAAYLATVRGGEVLLEGVDAEMMEAEEAEEMGQDLFDSVVCKKIYEEPVSTEEKERPSNRMHATIN